jgi:hypothetical protein
MTDNELQMMSRQYRTVRKAVYEEATRPFSNDPELYQLNKETLKKHVEKLSNDAVLDKYRGTDNSTSTALWRHLWIINRYAGIKAQIATNEVKDIENIFDDYEMFAGSEWNIEAKGNSILSCGAQVQAFLDRSGDFAGKQTIGNIPKLVKIVSVARRLKKFMEEKSANTPVLHFVTGKHGIDDVWKVHEHLMNIGYRSDLTVLHFLMTIGFQVIKPDIVISRLFLEWGWSHKVIQGLPKDLTIDDLQGKGNYGGRYNYTHERMYKPIIDLARRIVAVTKQVDLASDIGWVTENPIRELDLFLVKYGQKPEREAGIVRTLFSSGEPASINCISVRT